MLLSASRCNTSAKKRGIADAPPGFCMTSLSISASTVDLPASDFSLSVDRCLPHRYPGPASPSRPALRSRPSSKTWRAMVASLSPSMSFPSASVSVCATAAPAWSPSSSAACCRSMPSSPRRRRLPGRLKNGFRDLGPVHPRDLTVLDKGPARRRVARPLRGYGRRRQSRSPGNQCHI